MGSMVSGNQAGAKHAFGRFMQTILSLHVPYFNIDALADPGIAAGLGFLVATAMLGFWLFHFRKDVIKTFGYAYADRLFESIAGVKAAPKKRGKAAPKTADDAEPATDP